jgi:hypothetical protein
VNILAIDIGGTNVKLLVSGQPEEERRRFPSGPLLSLRLWEDEPKALRTHAA